MKKATLLFVVFASLVSCTSRVHPGYSELGQGIYYKIESFSETGLHPSQGDMVNFSISFFEGKERGWSKTVESLIPCDTSAKGLKGLLDRFDLEDSVSVRISPSLVGYDFGNRLDTSLGFGAIRLKILEIYPAAKWNSDMEAVNAVKREIENKKIAEFILADTNEEPFMLTDGIYRRILEKGTSGLVPSGKEIMVIYDCFDLEGNPIYSQTNEPESALWYSRGLKGALIPGIEKVILTMDLHDVVEVILPSELAYGKKGVREVGIAPWTPLRFIIRIEIPNKPV